MTKPKNTYRYAWDGPIFTEAGIPEGDPRVGIFHQEARYLGNMRAGRPSDDLRQAIHWGVSGLTSPMAKAMARTTL